MMDMIEGSGWGGICGSFSVLTINCRKFRPILVVDQRGALDDTVCASYFMWRILENRILESKGCT